MYDITPILKYALLLFSAVITCVIIPLIRSKTTLEQQTMIQSLVVTAVTAAEQLYTGSGRGAEKKAYVLDWLKARNITVDTDKLDAMIESAVYAIKN